MCRPTGSWFWSSWFRTGYPFQRRFLVRGMKNCGSRLYLLKIVADYEEAFIWCISRTNKEIETGLFQFTNFLERSIKNGPFLERGISFRRNYFLEHTHPKNTQVPPPPGSRILIVFSACKTSCNVQSGVHWNSGGGVLKKRESPGFRSLGVSICQGT